MFEYLWLMNYDQGCHLVRVRGWPGNFPWLLHLYGMLPPTTLIGNKRKTERKQLLSCSIPHRNFFLPGRVYYKMKTKYQRAHTSHVIENISNSSTNHSKFQSGSKKPREISKEVQMIKLHKYLSTK